MKSIQNLPANRVSIGMPVYNGGKFIKKALDSLISQTITDFELIISDNASTDDTESICREYAAKDSRIRYFRQVSNQGAVSNFKFVLDEATSDYFMWAAADDVWDLNWIEYLLPISSAFQCLAYALVISIDEKDDRISHPANNRKFNFSGNKLIRRCKYFIEPNMLGKANPIYGIYPIGKLREVGLSSFKEDVYGADMIFLYDLLNYVEIKHVPGTYLFKRIIINQSPPNNILKLKKKNIFMSVIGSVFYERFLPMINEYIKISNKVQATLLILLYPISILYNFIGIIRFRWIWRSY